MAKVLKLGDTHFGYSDGKIAMHQYFEKVYGEWLLPLIRERGIKQVYQFGDLFDKRKGVDSFSVSESKRYFFDPLAELGVQLIALIGNHDSFFTNSIDVNSPSLLLTDYRNIELITNPVRIQSGTSTIDIVPWICRDNEQQVANFIADSHSDYLFGHFEIEGFAMYKGVESQHGMKREFFKKYKKVYSGHFHTRSDDGNISYIGTPCEMNWSDYDDPRGVHIFDTVTGESEFVPCPFTIHTKLVYDEDVVNIKKLPDIKDKYVKLVVEKRTDFKKYDKYVTALSELKPHDLKIIEDFSQFNKIDVKVDPNKLQDTPGLIRQYVEDMDTELDKERLFKELHQLYLEAQAVE